MKEPMESRYYLAKNAFLDLVDENDYIDHDAFVDAYRQLLHSIEKPIKMIMVSGMPGTGKSMLLNHLYSRHRHQKEIHYFETPIVNEREFDQRFFRVITGKALPAHVQINFSNLLEYCRGLDGKRKIIVLLDEAQMYPWDIMERIRLISDTHVIKFVISLHKLKNEDLMTQAHFKSRIWERVELKNGSIHDVQSYLHKKLLKRNLYEIANTIKRREIRLIHSLTKGNYREINKLLFTVFEIYEYYDTHDPSKIEYDILSPKIIEMAGIKLGFIHA
jgi:type II secretory pathway predicted ATPase ExeA